MPASSVRSSTCPDNYAFYHFFPLASQTSEAAAASRAPDKEVGDTEEGAAQLGEHER